ncbi:unnamed protein product [Parajaminaea phylloscopi]
MTTATPARFIAGSLRGSRALRLAPPCQQAGQFPLRRHQSTTPSRSGLGPESAASSSPSTSSIHPSEIEHFTRLSSTWWDPHGELGLLHKMNKGRVQFLKDKVVEAEGWERAKQGFRPVDHRQEAKWRREWIKGKKVLDVGCGGGLLSESLARLGADVHGIDATQTNVAIAQSHASRDPFFSDEASRLRYSHCAAEDLLPDQAGTYDIVASVEVLEHVSSPAEFLHSLDRLLKPGGHLLLSTINRNALSWLLTIGVAEKLARLVSPGTHSWEKFIKPEEATEFICGEQGLGWYPTSSSSPSASPSPSLHDAAALPTPRRLQIESRGIAYDPLISDWRLLDRSGWLQSSGLGEACNYLLWARKPMQSAP